MTGSSSSIDSLLIDSKDKLRVALGESGGLTGGPVLLEVKWLDSEVTSLTLFDRLFLFLREALVGVSAVGDLENDNNNG